MAKIHLRRNTGTTPIAACAANPHVGVVSELITWGESIGVEATVSHEQPNVFCLDEITRVGSVKGAGATFIRALCARADVLHVVVYATVTGGNEALETYYRQFGFAPDEENRDEETGDVLIVREAR